ncbi:MlaD family protein [Nocardia sp. CDC160]|uniref:MlaD family protein n=1 Tax=Nocardia sp. CDC160 TaxID=3112166 RepID=UPI002DC05490|nr:MlaD family protein [Nocardia sp. CDC160]MEC3919349.1 MlaD family protein [Nocardia sp. CDC160]
MKRLLASQGFVTTAGVALAVLVAVAGYLLAFDPMKKTLSYCAIMPDSIGLYPGNHVTMLGIPVGSVGSVTPENGAVRVDFTIDAVHPLHGAVTATTVSDTLVADRDLEVLGDNTSPDRWPESTCVTKTFTPKSLTQTLDAFSKLADQLNGDGDPAQQNRLREGVSALEQATSGTGPKLNELIKELGAALNHPDTAIGHLGASLDAFASLASSVALNWNDIKVALTQANEGLGFVNAVWGKTIEIVDSLLVILPWFNTISHKYGRSILNGLDAAVPKLKLLSAGIASLQQLLGMIPAVVTAFEQFIDPKTGQVKVGYAPPRVALPPESADQVCAAVNALLPGKCRTGENGLASVDLVPLVLRSAGAR